MTMHVFLCGMHTTNCQMSQGRGNSVRWNIQTGATRPQTCKTRLALTLKWSYARFYSERTSTPKLGPNSCMRIYIHDNVMNEFYSKFLLDCWCKSWKRLTILFSQFPIFFHACLVYISGFPEVNIVAMCTVPTSTGSTTTAWTLSVTTRWAWVIYHFLNSTQWHVYCLPNTGTMLLCHLTEITVQHFRSFKNWA